MKTILNKWEFHYTFLILAFSLILTGYFANLLVFTSLIVIHELGHLCSSLILGFKVDKVIIYPYGGMIKYNDLINKNINDELLLAISGIIFQSFYYVIIGYLYQLGYIREYIFDLFTLYHYSMLFFNLLPIYPLDGSKIVNLVMCKYLSFYKANIVMLIISLLTIIGIIIFNIYHFNYSYIMMIGVIMQNLYTYYKNLHYLFYKFMLEKYLYFFNYKRVRVIDDKKKMYRDSNHFFKIGNKLYPEKKYLKRFVVGK